jgi:hypothetical protein
MRIELWESRLADLLEAARHKPYVIGEHDCFHLACQAIEVMTGVDRWPEFAGYKTSKQALKKMAQFGSTFIAAGDWFFGSPSISVKFARRGDICCIVDDVGERHLGICVGEWTAGLQKDGLKYVPTLKCECAWKVD